MDPRTDRLRDARAEAYDDRLVAALRAVVVEDAHGGPPPAADDLARRRRVRTPWAVAAAAAAVLVGGFVIVPTLQAEPAWAVSRNGAGDVEVEVNRFDDAAGLEAALAAEGVPADVTFLPDGTWCAPDRYASAEGDPSGMAVSVGEGHFGAKVPAGTVAPGSTLVITASARVLTAVELPALDEDPDDGWEPAPGGVTMRVEFDVAAGPVAGCTPVEVAPMRVG